MGTSLKVSTPPVQYIVWMGAQLITTIQPSMHAYHHSPATMMSACPDKIFSAPDGDDDGDDGGHEILALMMDYSTTTVHITLIVFSVQQEHCSLTHRW